MMSLSTMRSQLAEGAIMEAIKMQPINLHKVVVWSLAMEDVQKVLAAKIKKEWMLR